MIFDVINNLLNGNPLNDRSIDDLNPEPLEPDNGGGAFGDKFLLHVIPIEGNDNLFANRISYNTQSNTYYENGDFSNKYLKKWEEGAYKWDNIKLNIEYDWRKIYLARIPPTNEGTPRINDNGEICWKFDYRSGGYVIISLNLRLLYGIFDDSASVEWFIKPLPTMKNPNPSWKLIQIDQTGKDVNVMNEKRDVTQFIKDQYGFMLKARLSGGEETPAKWQKAQLFRQDWSLLNKDIDVENDETFGLDVRVILKPDITVDPLPKLLNSNDGEISACDLVIHYEFSTNDHQDEEDSSTLDKKSKDFNVHSKILSEYFIELLKSRTTESQDGKTLTLTDTDIPYETLGIVLSYLYTGTLPDIESYDEWTTLLCYGSKFLIPTLIQRCEEALKGYLNHDNLNEIATIADKYGAEQLLQCCKNFKPPKDDE